MKIEKLETSNNKFKYIVVGFILCAVIFILINYLTSRASYRNTESIDLAKGTITYKVPDLYIVAMYKIENGQETEITEMPGASYELETERSYCYTTNKDEHEAIELATDSEGNLVIGNLKKGSKCFLYFIKATTKKVPTILGELTVNLDTPDFSKTACDNGTNDETHSSGNCTSQDKGIYEAPDGTGTSYYYRGTVDNNWVQFGGYWWRIIRINGNGTVRMIYSGEIGNRTQPSEDDGRWVPKDNSQVVRNAFNAGLNFKTNNTHVGWRTGTAGANSYVEEHSNSTDSLILRNIKTWYDTDSKLSTEDKAKIDGATGFCNDRTPYPLSDLTSSSQPDTSQYGFGSILWSRF